MGPGLGTETVIRGFSAGWVTQEDLGMDKPYLGRGRCRSVPGTVCWGGQEKSPARLECWLQSGGLGEKAE